MSFWNYVAQGWFVVSLALGGIGSFAHGTSLLINGTTVGAGALGVLLLLVGVVMLVGAMILGTYYETEARVAKGVFGRRGRD